MAVMDTVGRGRARHGSVGGRVRGGSLRGSCLALALGAALAASLPASAALNTLTSAEADSGWVLLFDGRSLHGWHAKGDTVNTTTKWVIADSAIHLPRSRKAGNLYSPVRAASFELSFDWKIDSDSANSGVWMRILEDLPDETRSGPEVQIIGKKFPDYGKPRLTAGSHYMLYEPNPLPDAWIKPVGQWNTFKVVMDGKRVEHWANGRRIVAFEIGTSDWEARRKAANAARIQNEFYGQAHYGNFVLTDHDWPIWFRNLKVRPLSGTVLRPAFKGYTVSVAAPSLAPKAAPRAVLWNGLGVPRGRGAEAGVAEGAAAGRALDGRAIDRGLGGFPGPRAHGVRILLPAE